MDVGSVAAGTAVVRGRLVGVCDAERGERVTFALTDVAVGCIVGAPVVLVPTVPVAGVVATPVEAGTLVVGVPDTVVVFVRPATLAVTVTVRPAAGAAA